jgi:Flp pilus assembly protein TadD
MPSSTKEVTATLAFAGPIVESVLAKMKLTTSQRNVIDRMNKGECLASILQISKEQRDALLVQGYQFFRAGHLERARAVLTVLHQLQPLDSRVIYVLAVIFQTQGDPTTAARLFISFLALEAANPDGYLRLGECFLAAKEYDNAASTFRTALALCEQGRGSPASLDHARRMIDHVDHLDRRDSAST